MYKLLKTSEGQINSVLRIADSAAIPFNPSNTDYQAYLVWLAEGNTSLPADES